MALDKTGQWWQGSGAADIDLYLAEFTQGAVSADRFEHAQCSCGGRQFRIEADAEQGCVRRTCVACGNQHLMLDSSEHWGHADAQPAICPCGHDTYEVAVGFSHRRDRSIRWVTVGGRCVACGVLGAFADWKIDYAPAAHLYTAV